MNENQTFAGGGSMGQRARGSGERAARRLPARNVRFRLLSKVEQK